MPALTVPAGDTLLHALDAADGLPPATQVDLPAGDAFDIEPVMLPRDAFFSPKEDVAASQAIGRIAAEQLTPYPPGIPAIIPGERITAELVSYLRSGLQAGMQLPDPADPSLDTIRVVAQN